MDCKWSNFNPLESYTPWRHALLGSIVACPDVCMQKKGNAACCLLKMEIPFSIFGFMDCKWSNLNALESYTPWSHSLLGSIERCPFLCNAGEGKCCNGLLKIEIHFSISGFMDCKWSNLNPPGSPTPWCHSLLGPLWGRPFLCMQEKGDAAYGLLIHGNLFTTNEFGGLQMI